MIGRRPSSGKWPIKGHDSVDPLASPKRWRAHYRRTAAVALIVGMLSLATACGSCLLIVAASTSASAFARPAQRYCGRVQGIPVTAYNVSCARAVRIWRAAAGRDTKLPPGWTGANIDRAGGEALLFPAHDFSRVVRAEARRGLDVVRLGSVPVVLAMVPYGE